MKNNQNETNPNEKEETFLRIFDNVKNCKGLDWEEKAIFSNHISYLINDKEFFQTDSFQAKELGLSPAQVSKYTGRLKERELIDTRIEYVPNENGGRPIPKRYVTVIDINKWVVKSEKILVAKKILSPAKKKLARKEAELVKAKTTAEVNITDLTQSNPLAEQIVQLKKKVEVAEQKAVSTPTVSTISQPEKASSNQIEDLIDIVKSESFTLARENDLVKAILCGKIVSEKNLKEIIATMK
jgi:hypothetical protein